MNKVWLAVLLACLALASLPGNSQSASAPPELATYGQDIDPAQQAPQERPAAPAPPEDNMVSVGTAQTVATNWVALIVYERHAWAKSTEPEVGAAQELRRGARLLGYFVPVQPTGFVVVSLRRELEPVKAYSDESNLDPAADVGPAALIKDGMARILDAIETKAGPVAVASTEVVSALMEVDYRDTWAELERDPVALAARMDAGSAPFNYAAGQNLLASNWHQGPPYNDQTPWMNCSNSNGRALVGCVATAAAQILHYWDWPPDFDWDYPNMGDNVTTSSPQVQIDAVAHVSHDAGVAVGMAYGCDDSSAHTYAMEPNFESWGYGDVVVVYRPLYDAKSWLSTLQDQLNANRPIQYRILGHSIVADGWQTMGIVNQYHMNYGWADGHNTWYTVDALHQPGGGSLADEYMLLGIVPLSALGANVSGTITPNPWLYRYVDRDVNVDDAEFAAGVQLQFLPGARLRATGLRGGTLRFYGAPGQDTLLFSHGDKTQGIKIYDSGIRIYGGAYAGSIGFPR